jgi:hypothetical protein
MSEKCDFFDELDGRGASHEAQKDSYLSHLSR